MPTHLFYLVLTLGMFGAGVYCRQYPILVGVAGLLMLVGGFVLERLLYGPSMGYRIEPPSLYTVETFVTHLTEVPTDAVFGKMPIYVANPDIRPASGIFIARLNGEQAVVIESQSRESHA